MSCNGLFDSYQNIYLFANQNSNLGFRGEILQSDFAVCVKGQDQVPKRHILEDKEMT